MTLKVVNSAPGLPGWPVSRVGDLSEGNGLPRLHRDLADVNRAATSANRIHDMVFVAHGYTAGTDDHIGTRHRRLQHGPQLGRPVDAGSEIDDFDPGLRQQAAENEAVEIVDLAGQQVFAGLPEFGSVGEYRHPKPPEYAKAGIARSRRHAGLQRTDTATGLEQGRARRYVFAASPDVFARALARAIPRCCRPRASLLPGP